MKKFAISMAVALSACASPVLAAADDQDQPVRTMRNGLPTTPVQADPTQDDRPREGQDSAFARNRNVSVLERAHPEYQALGVPAGGFIIYPKISESLVYDDNVYANSTNAVGDWLFITKPQIRAESNWSRNQLIGYASVTNYSFSSLSNLNTTDYEVGFNGRYDIEGKGTYAFSDASFGRYTIPFTNLSVPRGATTSEQYDMVTGDVGAVQELNRFRFSERVDVADYKYQNLLDDTHAVLIEDTQDHTTYVGTAKGEYAISPSTAVFTSIAYNRRDYGDGGEQGVNSDGYEVTAGGSFDVTHLIRGQISVGYLQQDFAAAALANPPVAAKSVSGPAFHAKVEWFPTEITTVTLSGDREIEDFTAAGASGTLGTGGSLEVDHELLRNVILSARGGYNQYEYIGLGRTDSTWTAGFEANYFLTRHLGLNLTYRYMNQSSTDTTLDFRDNRLSLGATLQY